MNNIHYDFVNTGYKIHLPVVPDGNDPLTRKITNYLDQKFGLQSNFVDTQYHQPYYKVGRGGELEGGKGITLYGRNGSMQEMSELAKEIEQKFGKELADNVKKYNISFEDPLKLSNSVQARFAVYNHKNANVDFGRSEPLLPYCKSNPSGALPRRFFTRIDGSVRNIPTKLKSLSEIEKNFFHGDSTLYAIDNFGELFTGKIENGKVPQFIMDGLPKEYLQHYNITEKDIIARINKGTKQIVANMLEDAVNAPNSKILHGNPPWFATLDVQVIDEAKQLLAQYEPQTVQKLEQILPQLEQKCPAMSVLRQTTPFAQMKLTPVKPQVVNPVVVPNPVQQAKPQVTTPIGTQNPVTPKPQATPKQSSSVTTSKANISWFENLGTKGKVGLALAGVAIAVGSIYALSQKDTPKKSEMKQDVLTAQLSQQPTKIYQNPYNNYYYGTYNPYQTCCMGGLRV